MVYYIPEHALTMPPLPTLMLLRPRSRIAFPHLFRRHPSLTHIPAAPSAQPAGIPCFDPSNNGSPLPFECIKPTPHLLHLRRVVTLPRSQPRPRLRTPTASAPRRALASQNPFTGSGSRSSRDRAKNKRTRKRSTLCLARRREHPSSRGMFRSATGSGLPDRLARPGCHKSTRWVFT